jgi:KaiC/GvpD/RAD55 family RecA-like ATPase
VESLLQSARRRDEGEVLPTVFKTLAEKDIHFFRGSVHVIAAAPGVGKSILALCLAIQMGLPTLYICADTPRHITAVRAGQMLTHNYKAVVEAQLEEDDSSIWEAYKSADHIGAFYRSGISPDEITEMIGAFAEIRGEFPTLVILDNLTNVSYEGDSESAAQKRIVAELDTVAKDANICMVILMHVSGTYKNGTTPIPQDGVMNKLSEYQHTTLTLTRSIDERELLVACVKNRTGPSDPSGNTRFALRADFDVMSLSDRATSHESLSTPSSASDSSSRPALSGVFTARFDGECDECGGTIQEGWDEIRLKNSRPIHADCV